MSGTQPPAEVRQAQRATGEITVTFRTTRDGGRKRINGEVVVATGNRIVIEVEETIGTTQYSIYLPQNPLVKSKVYEHEDGGVESPVAGTMRVSDLDGLVQRGDGTVNIRVSQVA